jgi:hypothetical protein
MAGPMLIAAFAPLAPLMPGAGMFEKGDGGGGAIGAGLPIPNGSAATFAMPAGGGVGTGAATAGGGVGEKSGTGSSRRSAVARRPAEIGTTLLRPGADAPAPTPAANGDAGA